MYNEGLFPHNSCEIVISATSTTSRDSASQINQMNTLSVPTHMNIAADATLTIALKGNADLFFTVF